MSSEIGRLTNAERLRLNRRRTGRSQAQMARVLGLSLHVYGAWERGDGAPKSAALGQIRSYERCLLYRRRAGYTQAQVAKELGVSRYWLNQMELGRAKCDELICYWEQ